MGALDESLFRFINGWPESFKPFFWFLSEATKQDWVRIVLALMVVGMLIRSPKSRTAILLALLAWGLANGITEALKTGVHALRPCVALAEVNLRVGKLTSYGTASSHAANMAAIAFVFTALMGRWGWPWIALAFFVGLSRIYVGVHFPYQVLLGWLCGVFCGFLLVTMHRIVESTRTRRKLRRNGPLESADPGRGVPSPPGTADFSRRHLSSEFPRVLSLPSGTADFSRRHLSSEFPRVLSLPSGTADFSRRLSPSYNL